MKTLIAAIPLITLMNAHANCPDFSGNYIQDQESCRGDIKKRSPWPLINQHSSTIVNIEQNGCEKLKFSFDDTRFSNRPIEEVEINLNEASSIELDEKNLKMKFKSQPSKVSGFGHVLNAKEEEGIHLIHQNDESILIKSTSKLTGFLDYVIPIISKTKIMCRLIKKI